MINFKSHLVVDKSLYENMLQSNTQDIVNSVKQVVETPAFTKLSGLDSVTLRAKKHISGDWIIIKCAQKDMNIKTKGIVHSWEVLNQILQYICVKHDVTPRTAHPDDVIEAFKTVIKNFNLKA